MPMQYLDLRAVLFDRFFRWSVDASDIFLQMTVITESVLAVQTEEILAILDMSSQITNFMEGCKTVCASLVLHRSSLFQFF